MKLNTNAVAKSTVITLWLIVAMTIVTELSTPFKNVLIAIGGHHWVGKSLVAIVALGIAYVLFRKTDQTNLPRNVYLVIGSVVAGGLTIFALFLWEFLK